MVGHGKDKITVTCFVRLAVAQKILAHNLVDVIKKAFLLEVSVELRDRLVPCGCGPYLERVPPSGRGNPPSSTANVNLVVSELAARGQFQELCLGNLHAPRIAANVQVNDTRSPAR